MSEYNRSTRSTPIACRVAERLTRRRVDFTHKAVPDLNTGTTRHQFAVNGDDEHTLDDIFKEEAQILAR